MDFQLAARAEMLWPQQPIAWRAARLQEMGFGVGLWNWPDHFVSRLNLHLRNEITPHCLCQPIKVPRPAEQGPTQSRPRPSAKVILK